MKAKDLRIGNIIQWGCEYHTINMINSKDDTVSVLSKLGISYTTSICNLKPIQLTDELLNKAQFKFYDCVYYLDGLAFEMEKENPLELNYQDYIGCKIKYLHEMQNIVYLLNNKQLNFIE